MRSEEDVLNDCLRWCGLAVAVVPRKVEDLDSRVDLLREFRLKPWQLLLSTCLPTDRHVESLETHIAA